MEEGFDAVCRAGVLAGLGAGSAGDSFETLTAASILNTEEISVVIAP